MIFLQAAPTVARDAAFALNCFQAMLVLSIFLIPFYLLMRSLAKLTRIRYGLDGAPEDDGPPIRVCFNCNNTVLEMDFAHCPYCGSELEDLDVPESTADDADADDDGEAAAVESATAGEERED